MAIPTSPMDLTVRRAGLTIARPRLARHSGLRWCLAVSIEAHTRAQREPFAVVTMHNDQKQSRSGMLEEIQIVRGSYSSRPGSGATWDTHRGRHLPHGSVVPGTQTQPRDGGIPVPPTGLPSRPFLPTTFGDEVTQRIGHQHHGNTLVHWTGIMAWNPANRVSAEERGGAEQIGRRPVGRDNSRPQMVTIWALTAWGVPSTRSADNGGAWLTIGRSVADMGALLVPRVAVQSYLCRGPGCWPHTLVSSRIPAPNGAGVRPRPVRCGGPGYQVQQRGLG